MSLPYRATPLVTHSCEDLTSHSSEEHDHQSNGHLVSRDSPQISALFPHHRRNSIDSSMPKSLTVNYERRSSTTSGSCCSSRPLSPTEDTTTFNLESLQVTDHPQTPQGSSKLPCSEHLSSPGIPHKYSDPASHDIPVNLSPQPPLRKGHTRASSVGASPLWSQKGHKRMDSQNTVSMSQ